MERLASATAQAGGRPSRRQPSVGRAASSSSNQLTTKLTASFASVATGPGSLSGRIVNVNVIDNFDEGLDFDEEDEGSTDLVFININSSCNEDEGIKVSEEDDGDNIATLRNVTTDGDLEFEEDNSGIADISVVDSVVGDEMQIEADDGDPDTADGFYKERGSSVGDLDFEGDIVIL